MHHKFCIVVRNYFALLCDQQFKTKTYSIKDSAK